MYKYSTGSTSFFDSPLIDRIVDTWSNTQNAKKVRVRRSWRIRDVSAFTRVEVTAAKEIGAADLSALPGELITEDVSANLSDRRILSGVIGKFHDQRHVPASTCATALRLVLDLPRHKALPTVFADGEGGLTFAWSILGRGRTLIAIDDDLISAVGNAGTADAEYFPEFRFTGHLPPELLSLVP